MRDLEHVSNYYSDRINQFGPTSSGVDWNGKEGQLARFARFESLFERVPGALSVIDYGCGYGELHRFLSSRYEVASYVGVDVAPAMLEAARDALGDAAAVHLSDDLDSVKPAQCVVASGTYNVKLTADARDWAVYVFDDLKVLWGKATLGMAVNFLSTLSEPEKRQSKLFYVDPEEVIGFFLQEFSPLADLHHSYSTWEFTATVYRDL